MDSVQNMIYEAAYPRLHGGASCAAGALVSPNNPVVEIVSPGDASSKKGLSGDGKGVAAFVGKLYSMVEDEKCQHLLHWTNSGGFVVVSPDEFSKEVLPQYFKHNNFASFVRQLNMYGFHKVNDYVNAQPPQDSSSWEFSHPSFRKGKRELLHEIKRKISQKGGSPARMYMNTGSPGGAEFDFSDFDKTFKEQKDTLSIMSMRIMALEEKVKQVTDANQAVYNEMYALRQQVSSQQAILMQMATYLTQAFNEEAVATQPQVQTGQKRKRFSLEPSMMQAMSAAAAAAAHTMNAATAATNIASSAAPTDGQEQLES